MKQMTQLTGPSVIKFCQQTGCNLQLVCRINIATKETSTVCVCCDLSDSLGNRCSHVTGVKSTYQQGGDLHSQRKEDPKASNNGKGDKDPISSGKGGGQDQPRNRQGVEVLTVSKGKGPRLFGDLCPSCGNATFIFQGGCMECMSCGFSKC